MAATLRKADDALELEGRLTRLEGAVESIAGSVRVLTNHLDTITSRISGLGRTNWTLIVAIAGFLLALVIPLVTVSFFITKLSTESLISPMLAEQGVSRTEREELRRLAEGNAAAISTNKANIAHLVSAFGRSEMQDASIESKMASNISSIYREFGPVYEKVMGVRLPEVHFHLGVSHQQDLVPSQ